ncbi:hypothetical protein LJR034_003675 [Caballeronia sp. LjRoot34]|uniref:hypothetical protein n=1 Tax=Caballeronia sp. LjRoot34 TaxID=3342325 RepID=UPI003ED00140
MLRPVADGIQVVQAANGAISAVGAISLPASVKAGAYSYYRAKGGVTARTSERGICAIS